jgi:hypothetical protein
MPVSIAKIGERMRGKPFSDQDFEKLFSSFNVPASQTNARLAHARF